jgi:hypothetical protein
MSPVVARRNDRFGAGLVDRVEEVFSVIGPLGDDIVRPETLDQVCRIENVAARAGRGDEFQWRPKGIAGGMQLGRQAAF